MADPLMAHFARSKKKRPEPGVKTAPRFAPLKKLAAQPAPKKK